MTHQETWVPLSVRRRIDKEVDAVLKKHGDSTPDALARAVRNAVERILVPWGNEGQRFALAHPVVRQYLTFDGAVMYVDQLLKAMDSRSGVIARERAFAEQGQDTGCQEHDVARDAAIRLAHVVAPVAARLIVDGGQGVREDFDAELDHLLSVRLEGPVRQGAGERLGLVSQDLSHFPEGRLGVVGRDDRCQECLDRLDSLPPSIDGFRVSTEAQPPGFAHEVRSDILGAGSQFERFEHGRLDSFDEAGSVCRDCELMASTVEEVSEGISVDLGVAQEPVEGVQPEGLVRAEGCGCGMSRRIHYRQMTGDIDTERHTQSDSVRCVDGSLKGKPVGCGCSEIARHSGYRFELGTVSTPLRQRDPVVSTQSSSSVGGDDVEVGAPASSTGSGTSEPTEEATDSNSDVCFLGDRCCGGGCRSGAGAVPSPAPDLVPISSTNELRQRVYELQFHFERSFVASLREFMAEAASRLTEMCPPAVAAADGR